MTKWEYWTHDIDTSAEAGVKRLDQIGGEGWELVSAVPAVCVGGPTFTMVFKRPLEPLPPTRIDGGPLSDSVLDRVLAGAKFPITMTEKVAYARPPETMLYNLYVQTSDQYGSGETFGPFTDKALAEEIAERLSLRSVIAPITVNPDLSYVLEKLPPNSRRW